MIFNHSDTNRMVNSSLLSRNLTGQNEMKLNKNEEDDFFCLSGYFLANTTRTQPMHDHIKIDHLDFTTYPSLQSHMTAHSMEEDVMVIKKIYHVILSPTGGWSVIKSGALRASKHFSTQQEAVNWGRIVSSRQGTKLVIHATDGKVSRTETQNNQMSQ